MALMHCEHPIRRHRVKSTAVRTLGYDENDWVLQVEFANGKLYNYFRVPPSEIKALKDAASKGEYVNRQIKPYYEYEEVETESAA
jgi:hypothetical protein